MICACKGTTKIAHTQVKSKEKNAIYAELAQMADDLYLKKCVISGVVLQILLILYAYDRTIRYRRRGQRRRTPLW